MIIQYNQLVSMGRPQATEPAEGLSYLWRIGISRLSIRISSLRTLRLEREKRVGGEYLPANNIITAKAFRLKAKVSNLANGKMNQLRLGLTLFIFIVNAI